MLKWRFSCLVGLLIVLGILVEIDNAYKGAMDISNIVMPTAAIVHLPRAFHNSSVSEIPIVQEYDSMTMTSGTVMFMN